METLELFLPLCRNPTEAISSFGTPHVSRIFLRLLPSWELMLDSGSPLLTRSLTRTFGKIPTLLPMETDVLFASVNGNRNPPGFLERRAWDC